MDSCYNIESLKISEPDHSGTFSHKINGPQDLSAKMIYAKRQVGLTKDEYKQDARVKNDSRGDIR
jgi:hypothetical protein